MCDQLDEIRARGADLAIIGNGTPAQARAFLEEVDAGGDLYTDPDRRTYGAVGAHRGLRHVLRPGTFLHAIRALLRGDRPRALAGDSLQLGGTLIVEPSGHIPWQALDTHPGDHASVREILAALDALREKTRSSPPRGEAPRRD